MIRSIGGAAIICLLLAGCAPIESEVDHVSPAPNGTTESATFVIEVAFDHAMDPATINTVSFRVIGEESGAHSGEFLFLADNTIVEFTSTTGFVEGETVTVRLTDEIRSRSNKRLDEYSWTFRVSPPPPPTPFHLESLDPPIETVGALATDTIQIALSSMFDPFGVGDGTVNVEGERSGRREPSYADIFTSGPNLRVNVDRPFLAGERVTVAFTDLLRSIEGVVAPATLVQYTVRNGGTLWPTTDLDTGTGLVGGSILFFDPDVDGRDEWVVVGTDGTILLQDVDGGGLSGSTGWDVGEDLAGAAVGDFDGDGLVDLAALAAAGDRLFVLLGSNSLALLLEDPVTISLDRSATGLVAAHADADGTIDLVTHDSTGVAVAWGDTDSPLATQSTLPAVAPLAAPAVGDLDADGLPDLAVPVTGGDIVVLRATGPRVFATDVTLTPTAPATGVLAVSLDGDDIIDLVATAAAGASPTTFLPRGAMDFDARTLFVDTATAATVAVDIDGDGASDLLTPMEGATGVRIAYGLGDGNVAKPVTEKTATEVASLSLGDTNADGVLDLAFVHTDGTWRVSPGDPAHPPLSNRISVEDISADAGDTGVPFTVVADHAVTLEGYTVVLEFDPAVLTVDAISTLGTDAGALGAEFEVPTIDNTAGVVIHAVIIDFLPPYAGLALPPGSGDTIAAGTFSVDAAASGTTSLAPTDGLGSPPTDNTFVSGGLSYPPSLVAGTVTIGSGPPPPSDPPFIRGDANRDGAVDVSDGTTVQNWIAGLAAEPPCLDAADANDDGTVDISDSVYLFDFLFSGGSAPPSPYPLAGSDPTTDPLDCAM